MLTRTSATKLGRTLGKRYASLPAKSGPEKKTLMQSLLKIPLDAASIATVLGSTMLGYQIIKESNPGSQKPQTATTVAGARKKNLVILGSGWGSATLLKDLDTSLYNVTVVSPRNYFLFTPLLPSCPTGTIELRSVVEPVRSIARRTPGTVTYLEADCKAVDTSSRQITIEQASTVRSGEAGKDSSATKSTVLSNISQKLNYDYLVVGVGAQPSTFGIPGVAENACFLKELEDAIEVRRRILDSIEAAALLPVGSEERKRLLHIVIVGGGPTGVEFAGELQDYVKEDLQRWMPELASEIQVTLIEALPNVLNAFSKKLYTYAHHVFEEEKINLVTNTAVKNVDSKIIKAQTKKSDGSIQDITLPYGVMVWATGNAPRDLTKSLFAQIPEQNEARRGLFVDEHMKVKGTDNLFAIGDCSFTGLPPTAQTAHQEAEFLAKHFKKLAAVDDLQYELSRSSNADERSKVTARMDRVTNSFSKFEYHHMGALSYVGADKAVADLTWGKWSSTSTGGPLTYIMWRSAYIMMCLSARTKALVAFDWIKCSIFGRDTSRD